MPNNSIVLQKVTLIEYTCWVHFVCCRTVRFCAFFDALARFCSCREDWKDEEMLFSLCANIFKHSPCVLQMFCKCFANVLQHGTTQNAAFALHCTVGKMLIYLLSKRKESDKIYLTSIWLILHFQSYNLMPSRRPSLCSQNEWDNFVPTHSWQKDFVVWQSEESRELQVFHLLLHVSLPLTWGVLWSSWKCVSDSVSVRMCCYLWELTVLTWCLLCHKSDQNVSNKCFFSSNGSFLSRRLVTSIRPDLLWGLLLDCNHCAKQTIRARIQVCCREIVRQ